jgi:hypothetical protein
MKSGGKSHENLSTNFRMVGFPTCSIAPCGRVGNRQRRSIIDPWPQLSLDPDGRICRTSP